MVCFEDLLILSLSENSLSITSFLGCTVAKKQIILGGKNTGISQREIVQAQFQTTLVK